MRVFLIGVALLAMTASAQGALNIVSSTYARQCYEAAIAGQSSGAAICERALSDSQMTPRDRAATLVNRGIIYNSARQFDLAVADFSAALAIDPNFGEAYLNRGNSNFLRRKFDDALADYNKAIDLKIANLDYAYYDRALVYEVTGKLPEAKSDLKAALALSPDFKAASDRMTLIDQRLASGASAPTATPLTPPAQTPAATGQAAPQTNP